MLVLYGISDKFKLANFLSRISFILFFLHFFFFFACIYFIICCAGYCFHELKINHVEKKHVVFIYLRQRQIFLRCSRSFDDKILDNTLDIKLIIKSLTSIKESFVMKWNKMKMSLIGQTRIEIWIFFYQTLRICKCRTEELP